MADRYAVVGNSVACGRVSPKHVVCIAEYRAATLEGER